MAISSIDLAVTAAQQGQGLALADPALVGDAMRGGLLVQVHPVPLDPGMGYSLIAPRTSGSHRGFSQLREWLKQQADMTRRELAAI